MAFPGNPHQKHIPFPSDSGSNNTDDHDVHLSVIPIHIVTNESRHPTEFLYPSPKSQLVIEFDCEDVDLCRTGTFCIIQLAYYPLEKQEGQTRMPSDCISFVRLRADPCYCDITPTVQYWLSATVLEA